MSVVTVRPSRVGGHLAISGAELAAITGAELLVDGMLPVRGALVDSRRVAEQPGALFLALPDRKRHSQDPAHSISAGADC
ncbi:MAG: hypothetical protein ACKOJD_07625 [Candidatus Limnocylindrus sp.]